MKTLSPLLAHLAAEFERLDRESRQLPQSWRFPPRLAAILTLVLCPLILMGMQYSARSPLIIETLALWQRQVLSLIWDLGPPEALRYEGLLRRLAWVWILLVSYVGFPLAFIVFGMRARVRDFFLTGENFVRHLPVTLLFLIPIGIAVGIAAQLPEFTQKYPFYRQAIGNPDRIAWELAYAVQFVALEFFFRGFLLRALAPEFGAFSIFVALAPYVMLHFTKPLPECLLSILAGIVLGGLALQRRSIWSGALIHVCLGLSMDAAAIWKAKLPF